MRHDCDVIYGNYAHKTGCKYAIEYRKACKTLVNMNINATKYFLLYTYIRFVVNVKKVVGMGNFRLIEEIRI